MNKSEKILSDFLIKGKKVPVGTVRGNMIKTAAGWKWQKKGSSSKVSTEAKEASKEKKESTDSKKESTGIDEVDKVLANHGKSSTTPNISRMVLSKMKEKLAKKVDRLAGGTKTGPKQRADLKKYGDALGKIKNALTHHESKFDNVKKSEDIIINFMKSKNE